MNISRLCVGVVLVALAAGLIEVGPVSAAKPGGGGGSPPGKIYYTTNTFPDTIYQMNPDGSGKSAALPPDVIGVPSGRVYDGERWWLMSLEIEGSDPNDFKAEVFAYRADLPEPIRLTNLTAHGVGGGDQPQWSNDLLDSSATLHVNWDVDGDTVREVCVVRLPITDATIEAIAAGAPLLTDEDCEILLTVPYLQPGDDTEYAFRYAASSDPSKLAYTMYNLDANGTRVSATLRVRTATPDGQVDVPLHTDRITSFRWSHSGATFLFGTANSSSSYGGVWRINANGTGLTQLKSNNGTMEYGPGPWSPDDQHVLIHSIKDRGFGRWYYNINRMPATGGSLVNLTGDMTETIAKFAFTWVP